MKFQLIFFLVLLSACSVNTIESPSSNTINATPTPAVSWWRPEIGNTWQIQFGGNSIDTSLDVDVYDLDLFDTSAEIVAGLHADGKHVMCYLNAGAWEDWRPDADAFPEEIIGNDYEGWPGEQWLDISSIEILAPVMQARLDLCAEKGFDGVDPDNLDGAQNDTGFDINIQEQLAYAHWLSAQAHARGLAIGLKNVPEYAKELEPDFDWALTESCFAQEWCAEMQDFIDNNKPVFAIEYVEEGMTIADFCPLVEDGFSAILKNRDLDAWVENCN